MYPDTTELRAFDRILYNRDVQLKITRELTFRKLKSSGPKRRKKKDHSKYKF
jgi:hypothetical protein